MEKPIISDNFTIEDIHKIREYNYSMNKNLSLEEKRLKTLKTLNKLANEFSHIKEIIERDKDKASL